MNSIDKYLVQAMDSYPYSLEETLESLDYALASDENNTMALCLYGRLYAEQMFNYEEAKLYFERALSIDVHALAVYPYYIETLVLNEDYEDAERMIQFAFSIKGINKAEILVKQIFLYEQKHMFMEAKETLKKAKLYVYNDDAFNVLETIQKRIKEKMRIIEGKPKKKKKSNKKADSKKDEQKEVD